MQLDQKKEELYDLLRKVTGNSKYRHPFWYARSQNNRLQELLSLHVDVRPDDRAWYLYTVYPDITHTYIYAWLFFVLSPIKLDDFLTSSSCPTTAGAGIAECM
jgi:hypothetical protein